MTKIMTSIDNVKITKANKLVEVKLLEVGNRLKLRDQKVVLAVVGQISPEDDDFKHYHMTISELIALTGISKENLYRDIYFICARLAASIITIREPDNPKGFLIVTWFSHARYDPDKGRVEFSISPELKPYLLQVKSQFTTYSLKQVVHLKSTYSIRLYELLRQFLPLKEARKGKVTAFREITINDMREYLGVKPKQYSRFRDLRRYILEKCQKELEDSTDLTFEFTPIRKGRKIQSINFHIKQNQQFQEVADEELPGGQEMPLDTAGIDQHVMDCIRGLIPNITNEQLSLIGKTCSREQILEGLFDLMKAMTSDGVNGTPLNYYLGILKNKRREEKAAEPKAGKTTEEKLSDRSWADGLDMGEENKC